MNSTIRKMYTFRKKQKSFDKTFGAKFVQDILSTIVAQKIEFSEAKDRCKTEEDVDLDDLIIHEMSKTQENEETYETQIDQVVQEQTDIISPKKKIIASQFINYGLIYRMKKSKQNLVVVPCKVSLRAFKMTQQDIDFINNFDTLELQYQPPSELDFLEPINEFYRKINEIVLNQL